MASPAKVTEILPDTLPEDFGEWDDEKSPSTQPIRLASSEHGPGLGAVPRPATQPAESHDSVTAPGNLLRGAALSASAPKFVKHGIFLHRVRSLSPALDRPHEIVAQRLATAPAPQAAAMTEADEILPRFFRAETTEPKPAKKKRPIIAGTSAALVVVLAAAMIPVLSHRTASSVKPVAAPEPAVTVIQQPEDATLKPTLSTPTVPAPTQPVEAARARSITQAQRRRQIGRMRAPSRAQVQMMNNQLRAPARTHMAAAPAVPAPPPLGGFAAADVDGSGNNNAIGSVFSSAKQPSVWAASPEVVTVSSGVIFGLLIQKRPPDYPEIAKAARVSGTVVLAATISKTGTIKNLHVVSGPVMLQESAVDAVWTWRYKPYKLNNQPTEVETTINVIFSLDN
jgi:TonB family protein